jgi:hypothetical protein
MLVTGGGFFLHPFCLGEINRFLGTKSLEERIIIIILNMV